MKKYAMMALIAFLIMSHNALAQDNNRQRWQMGNREFRDVQARPFAQERATPQARAENMAQQLELTAEQTRQVQALFERQEAQLREQIPQIPPMERRNLEMGSRMEGLRGMREQMEGRMGELGSLRQQMERGSPEGFRGMRQQMGGSPEELRGMFQRAITDLEAELESIIGAEKMEQWRSTRSEGMRGIR